MDKQRFCFIGSKGKHNRFSSLSASRERDLEYGYLLETVSSKMRCAVISDPLVLRQWGSAHEGADVASVPVLVITAIPVFVLMWCRIGVALPLRGDKIGMLNHARC